MKQLFFYLVGLVALTNTALAQSDCPCCTESHKQFDFWVGDWVVFDTEGKQVGENTIVTLEQNCILNEHWRGATGYTGRSYNYYDSTDSTWNQLWVASDGSNLVLKGKASENQMELKSKMIPGKKVDWYYNRITWTNNEDGTVTQLWEILDEGDNLLTVAFKGIYKRRE